VSGAIANRPLSWFGLLFVCALTTACGRGGPDVYAVSGTVRYDGQPVDGGTVTFVPDDGRPISASLSSDGSYRLEAVAGKHRVAVLPALPPLADMTVAPDLQPASGTQTDVANKSPIPEKYKNFETSGVTVEVKPVKQNELAIGLSKGSL